MGVKSILDRLSGGGSADEDEETATHVCEDCGERYFVDGDEDVSTCRACGGIRVTQA